MATLKGIKIVAKKTAEGTTKRNLLEDAASDSEDASAEETPIWLTLTTKREIQTNSKVSLQPGKVTLPHSLNTDPSTSICLITADPQRAYKNLVASEEFPEDTRKRITRIIDFSKLKAKYSRYEAQRNLYAGHDVFLADTRIINRLPQVLGKTFFKTTAKRPIPVVISTKPVKGGKKNKNDEVAGINAASPATIAREVEKAFGAALVSIPKGRNIPIRIGYASWTPEQIADNVEAVVSKLVEQWVPRKWDNVRAINIKGPQTVSLPIWESTEMEVEYVDEVAELEGEATEDAQPGTKEKRKRQAAKDGEEASAPGSKKSKNVPEGDDSKLDKQISARKEKLKKQKAVASKAMDN